MEARNMIMAEKAFKTDARFQFLNAVYPYKRKRMLKTPTEIKRLPEGSADIYKGDYISAWYPNRPESLNDLSLYEFARTYERMCNSKAEQVKDKSTLLKLRNEQGFMKERTISSLMSSPVIVYGPSNIDPISRTEEFYYSNLLLHKPWLDESELKGPSATYKAEFLRLKDEIPALAQFVDKVLKKKHMKEIMSRTVDAQLSEEERAANELADAEQDSSEQNGSDFFETVRKQSSIETEEQLNEAVAGLSKDQLKVYNMFVTNVEHYYAHQTKPMSCCCGAYEPLHLYVSGFGGSGKSHLIRTLMGYQYVMSEVQKKPCHFLLGAPTGMASCNISGQTLHSMWNLPVEHGNKLEYRVLYPGTKNRMQANYLHSCGHIVDEVSMISNQMLMFINMRMMEVKGSTELFGGMPFILFGDLFQLEPVNGAPPFVRLTPEQARKLTGGLPCAPDIWKSFQFEELTTNHRQEGEENSRWRELLSRVRFGMLESSDVQYLNERLIDTTGCKKASDYLNAYITKFLECEAEGLNPVCLLPKRSMCDEYNRAIMARKGEVPTRVLAKDRFLCSRNKQKLVQQKLKTFDERETAGLEDAFDVALNTRVMLRTNDKRTPGLVNGARGTVREIIKDCTGKTVTKIMVKFDNIDEVQCIERTERKFRVLPGCYVYRSMFPLINSYAMTIHKSQSLSLSCVFADLGNEIFTSGMSYVALSRCTSHKGLYLMNFNPKKVKASRKACIEYSRLLGCNLAFNKGVKFEGLERPWYSTYAQRFATKATASDIKQEKKKRKATTSKDGLPNKKTKTGNTPADAKKQPRPPPKGKERPPPKKGQPTLVSIANGGVTDNPTITAVIPAPPFNYCPTNETWQQAICSAFNWPFVKSSRPQTVPDVYGVNPKVRPRTDVKIRSSGNCWYETISHIVTGSREHYMLVKESVITFMQTNVTVMQGIFHDSPLLLSREMYRNIRYSDHAAQDVIAYHQSPNVWADNVTMEMTACMLNTNYRLYYIRNGWDGGLRIRHHPFWAQKQNMESIADIEETTQQFMYIYHQNGNHFVPCHTGLMGSRR